VAAAAALAMSALAAACTERQDPGGTPHASKVASLVPRIEKATGLRFKKPPAIETRTQDEVRRFLEMKFTEDMPASELQGMERVYKRFGLLPDTLNLQRFMLALLSEQVIGYYDPKPKVLYVVEGASPESVDLTISHELVHALQDQYFNLDSLQRARDDNDRTTAAQAVMEGQATLEGIGVMIGGDNFVTRLPGGWDRVRQMIRDAQGSMPVYASAPMLLQETLIFPYLSGAEFMRRFKDRNPGKSPFDDMPASTEQIMHSDRFAGETRDAPSPPVLPPPRSGRVVYENNLGEFEIRLLLYQWINDQSTAVRGAAGWDGDRYQLIDTGQGEALVWVSVWDTSIDAAEFFSDLDVGITRQYAGATALSTTPTHHRYSARGRVVSVEVSDVGGRPIVLFTDAPAGVTPALIDISKVTLRE
jgi:hypothetical protein